MYYGDWNNATYAYNDACNNPLSTLSRMLAMVVNRYLQWKMTKKKIQVKRLTMRYVRPHPYLPHPQWPHPLHTRSEPLPGTPPTTSLMPWRASISYQWVDQLIQLDVEKDSHIQDSTQKYIHYCNGIIDQLAVITIIIDQPLHCNGIDQPLLLTIVVTTSIV